MRSTCRVAEWYSGMATSGRSSAPRSRVRSAAASSARPSRAGSAAIRATSASRRIWRSSSPLRAKFTGTCTAPMDAQARKRIAKASEFAPKAATRSPGEIPAASSRRAVLCTADSNSRYVQSRSSKRRAVADGLRRTLRRSRSRIVSPAGGCPRGGVMHTGAVVRSMLKSSVGAARRTPSMWCAPQAIPACNRPPGSLRSFGATGAVERGPQSPQDRYSISGRPTVPRRARRCARSTSVRCSR